MRNEVKKRESIATYIYQPMKYAVYRVFPHVLAKRHGVNLRTLVSLVYLPQMADGNRPETCISASSIDSFFIATDTACVRAYTRARAGYRGEIDSAIFQSRRAIARNLSLSALRTKKSAV